MKTEIKLKHDFLMKHLSVLELVLMKLKLYSVWNNILENKNNEEIIFEVVGLVSDENLPTLHFLTRMKDTSFDHEFGTRQMFEPEYKSKTIVLQIGHDYFESSILARQLSRTDFDALEDLAAREVNGWEGPYE